MGRPQKSAAALEAAGAFKRNPNRAEGRVEGARRKSFTGLPPAKPEPRDYAGILKQYAEDIVAGKIPAGKYVRLACKRHLDEVARSAADPSYPFEFDEAAANDW